MTYLLRLVACLFVLLSFSAKALVINGCVIVSNTSCRGADLSGANLAGFNLENADLVGADLTNANLSNVNLASANLANANLSGTYGPDANMGFANLLNANLSNATLTNALLNDVNLYGADMSNADLTDANLWEANLGNANLANAILIRTVMYGADLSTSTTIVGVNPTGAPGFMLPSGHTIEGLIIKLDGDNDGYSDELEIAISGDATSVDSTVFDEMLANLTADADNDGLPDDIENIIGEDATSTSLQNVLDTLSSIATNKNVPAMGSIGLLALGLSILGLGAVRLRKK